jgi:hypothetical protein
MLAKCQSLANRNHVVQKQIGTIDVRYQASAAVPGFFFRLQNTEGLTLVGLGNHPHLLRNVF